MVPAGVWRARLSPRSVDLPRVRRRYSGRRELCAGCGFLGAGVTVPRSGLSWRLRRHRAAIVLPAVVLGDSSRTSRVLEGNAAPTLRVRGARFVRIDGSGAHYPPPSLRVPRVVAEQREAWAAENLSRQVTERGRQAVGRFPVRGNDLPGPALAGLVDVIQDRGGIGKESPLCASSGKSAKAAAQPTRGVDIDASRRQGAAFCFSTRSRMPFGCRERAALGAASGESRCPLGEELATFVAENGVPLVGFEIPQIGRHVSMVA